MARCGERVGVRRGLDRTTLGVNVLSGKGYQSLLTSGLSRSGYVELWGPPGSGGSTHKLQVIGGRIGINTYDARAIPGVEARYAQNSQPNVVLSGVILKNQTSYAVTSDTRGPLVLVGCRILRDREGSVLAMRRKHPGDCLSGQINLIDSSIEYAVYSEANVVVTMEQGGRSFLMENCFIRHARQICTPDTPANPAGRSMMCCHAHGR